MKEKLIVPIGEKDYLNQTEAAAYLGISRNRLSEWEVLGLKKIRLGEKTVFYSKKHIEEFLEQFIV